MRYSCASLAAKVRNASTTALDACPRPCSLSYWHVRKGPLVSDRQNASISFTTRFLGYLTIGG